MKNKSLIQILKSNEFAIMIAILSVIVQSFHSFTAFYNVSSLKGTVWGIAQAVLFATIIDLAILFYTVRKNVKVTWMAGFIMVLINCYYYYSHLGLSFDLILGGLLSLVIPVSVYYYSEEIHDDVEFELGQRDEIPRLEKQNEELNEHLGRRLDDIVDLENKLKTVAFASKAEEEKSVKYIGELRETIKIKDQMIASMRGPDKIITAPELPASEEEDKFIVKASSDEPHTGFAHLKSDAHKLDDGESAIPRTDRPIR